MAHIFRNERTNYQRTFSEHVANEIFVEIAMSTKSREVVKAAALFLICLAVIQRRTGVLN